MGSVGIVCSIVKLSPLLKEEVQHRKKHKQYKPGCISRIRRSKERQKSTEEKKSDKLVFSAPKYSTRPEYIFQTEDDCIEDRANEVMLPEMGNEDFHLREEYTPNCTKRQSGQ